MYFELWPVLADAVVKGLIVLSAVWMVTLTMRRASAAVRHLTWVLAVSGTLMLPMLSAFLPGWRVLPAWMATQPVATSSMAAAVQGREQALMPVASRNTTLNEQITQGSDASARLAAAPPRENASPSVNLAIGEGEQTKADSPLVQRWLLTSWQAWMLAAWGCGAVIVMLPDLFSLFGLWRLGRRMPRIEEGSWKLLLADCGKRLGVRQPITLLRGRRQGIPMTWGIVSIKLLLPAEAEQWSIERRRVVLLHELAHIRRRDFLTQLIVRLARAVYWFNPLIWIASKQVALESEGACDDLVLAHETKASDYAEHLLAVVAGFQDGIRLPAAAVAMTRSARLEGRLVAILDANRNRRTPSLAAVVMAGSLLAGGLLPLAMLRAGPTQADEPAVINAAPAQNGQIDKEAVVKPRVANHIELAQAAQPPAAQATNTDAREAFLAIERIARLAPAEQAKEITRLYRELAPRHMSFFIEAILSSVPSDILEHGPPKGMGGNKAVWARQLADAASKLTPEEVADKLKDRMRLALASRSRAIQMLKAHATATDALIREDLKSGEKASVERAGDAILALDLKTFTPQLLAMFLAEGEASEPAGRALLFLSDPAIVEPLLARVKEDPNLLIRCAGHFQGPLHRKPADPLLLKLLDFPGAEIRYHAGRAVYECRDPKLAAPAAKFALETEPRFRVMAAYLASNLPADVFAANRQDFIGLLRDSEDEVQLEALRCFAQQKDIAAGPVIRQRLEVIHPGPAGQREIIVMQALAALTGQQFGYDMHNWGTGNVGNQRAIRQFEDWMKKASPVKRVDGAIAEPPVKRGVAFRAIVVDSESGKPIANVRVGQREHKELAGTSGDDGAIVISGTPTGKLTFYVASPGYARWWSPQAVQPHQQKEVRDTLQRNFDDLEFDVMDDMPLVKIELERDVRITGVVQDPDGHPVAGATVAPAHTGTGNSLTGDTRYSVLTAKDGRFAMTMPASGKVKYNLTAHDGQYGQWRQWANGVLDPIQTKPGDELKNVVIKLTRPATVRGHVSDESGKPLAGRDVRASAADKLENRYYDPTTKTDKDGNFELRFIRPGDQFIQSAPFFWTNVPPGGMTLELKEGQTNSLKVNLKAGETKEGVKLTAPASTAFPSHEEQLRRALKRMERDAIPRTVPLTSADAAPVHADLGNLKGTWKVMSIEGDGLFRWRQVAVGDSLVIDRVSDQPAGSRTAEHDYYEVSARKSPKEFNVTFWVENLFLTQNGIYQLEGDSLTLCVAPYEKARPKKLVAETGKSLLIVLKRMVPG